MTGSYIENWTALLTSAEDLDEMKELADFGDPSSMQAFTTAYSQLREAQRMDDLDTEEMEEYAKHLQDIAKESDVLADSLEEDEEGAEDLAIQIMNMNKGVKKLADG